MEAFCTGLFPFDHELVEAAEVRGKNWRVAYEDVEWGIRPSGSGRQVVIYARSCRAASNAYHLILSALAARRGDYGEACSEFPRPINGKTYEEMSSLVGSENIVSGARGCGFIPDSVRMAARASMSVDLQYGLLRYAASGTVYSVNWIDVDPFFSTVHLGVSWSKANHVAYANAIVGYYSVMEQIGAEIRASKDKPSMIKGAWNPVVHIDLTDRLVSRGVCVDVKQVWHRRGGVSLVESNTLNGVDTERAEWSRGAYCRDCMIDVRDAIRISSALRSKVSSHRIDRKAAGLSAYDVVNVKEVSRRILLTSLGCRIYEERS